MHQYVKYDDANSASFTEGFLCDAMCAGYSQNREHVPYICGFPLVNENARCAFWEVCSNGDR